MLAGLISVPVFKYWPVHEVRSSEFRRVCYRINILGSRLSPSSINLVLAQAGKVTVRLASHWPCVTDTVVYPPMGSTAKDREMRGMALFTLPLSQVLLLELWRRVSALCKGKVALLRLECRRGAHLPFQGREPVGGNTTVVCDTWPVRRQTYGYLPSLRQY